VEQPTDQGGIDRSSPVPLYHQLETLIRKGIDSGRYPPGSLLPSEGDLCTRYGVSRSVVRQTLTNLAHEGVIRTQRGRGSFVAEEKLQERFVQRAAGLFEDLKRMGYEIRTAVLDRQPVELPLPVQEFLGTSRGLRIDRLRSVEGRVLVYIRSYLPEEPFSSLLDEELEDRSLYGLLQKRFGLRPVRGNRSVEAVAANAENARHLEVDVGEPLLFLRGTSRDQDGRPLEWFEAWHRGDRTSFEIEIVPSAGAAGVGLHVDRGTWSPASSETVPAPGAGPSSMTPMLRRDLSPAGSSGLGIHDRIAGSRAIVVVGAGPVDDPRAVAAVLEEHGFSVLAVTIDDERSLQLLEAIASGGAFVGARGVLDGAGTRRAVAAGACFLMAPIDAQAEVLPAADGIPVVFSGLSPSEVANARRVSPVPVEVFPIGIGGVTYFQTLQASLPGVPLVPTGGITEDDAAAYLEAGAFAVGLDTALCRPEALAVGDLDDLTARAARFRRSLGGDATD
jgi:GntR family transcriptional regulator